MEHVGVASAGACHSTGPMSSGQGPAVPRSLVSDYRTASSASRCEDTLNAQAQVHVQSQVQPPLQKGSHDRPTGDAQSARLALLLLVEGRRRHRGRDPLPMVGSARLKRERREVGVTGGV